jgi:hypothetical protein
MLSAYILRLATEHAHGKSLFDELMAVNWGRDGGEDFLVNVGKLGQISDLFFIFVSQLYDLFITESLQVVDFY